MKGPRLGLHRPVIFATATWKVARDMHFAFDGFDVVDGFGVTALAGLLAVNGHAKHYHGQAIRAK